MLNVEFLDARHGDCILLTWADGHRAMLVDGGPTAVYEDMLRPRLDRLPSPANLEAVCVSHVDDDHLGGILRLCNDINRARRDSEAESVRVGRLWFNTLEDLVDAETPGLAASVRALPNDEPLPAAVGASYRQGSDMRRVISSLGLSGNSPFDGPVRQGHGVELPGGLRVQVVAPDRTALSALAAKWRKAARTRDPGVVTAGVKDRSVPNLSSICLHITYREQTLLLTGDARGDQIINGLTTSRLLADQQPLHLDVLKLPHHGSAKNVTPEFFRRIHADHYVVCADGLRHRHPDPRTLTWIVESRAATDRYTIHLTSRVAAALEHLETLTKGRKFTSNVLTEAPEGIQLPGRFLG